MEDCGLRRYDKVKIPIYADGAQYKIRSAAGSVVNEIGYICGSYYHESTCFSFDGDKEFKVIADNIGKILLILNKLFTTNKIPISCQNANRITRYSIGLDL